MRGAEQGDAEGTRRLGQFVLPVSHPPPIGAEHVAIPDDASGGMKVSEQEIGAVAQGSCGREVDPFPSVGRHPEGQFLSSGNVQLLVIAAMAKCGIGCVRPGVAQGRQHAR